MFDLLSYLLIAVVVVALIARDWLFPTMQHVADDGLLQQLSKEITDLSDQLNALDISHPDYQSILNTIKEKSEQYRDEQNRRVHTTSAWQMNQQWFDSKFRAIRLFIVVSVFFLISILIIHFLYNQLENDQKIPAVIAGLVQFSIFLLSIPAMFMVWLYRDLNKRREIETEHKDKLFSEYKQLVEWATKANKDISDTTQIAAIYQLAPFLKDHHATLYQRSTLETLRAIVNASRPEWEKWAKDYEEWESKHQVGNEPVKPELSGAVKAVHAVLREHPVLFYHEKFKPEDFNLAGIDFWETPLFSIKLTDSNIISGNLAEIKLYHSDIKYSQLQKIDFRFSKLESIEFNVSNLFMASFEKSKLNNINFSMAQLSGANFKKSQIKNCNFTYAILLGADFRGSKQENVSFHMTIVDEPKLIDDDENKKVLETFIKQGAISIADKQVMLHKFFSGGSIVHSGVSLPNIQEQHDIFSKIIEEKNLFPTTKKSLEAEEQANQNNLQ